MVDGLCVSPHKRIEGAIVAAHYAVAVLWVLSHGLSVLSVRSIMLPMYSKEG